MSVNFAIIQGRIATAPFFNLVPGADGGSIPFLRIFVDVYRDSEVYDRIRVVAYGDLAEKMYAILEVGSAVMVRGWMQVRRNKGKGEVVVELVAREITVIESLLPHDDLERLQTIAARAGVEPRELVKLLLEPQLVALETGLLDEGLGEDLPVPDGNGQVSQNIGEDLLHGNPNL